MGAGRKWTADEIEYLKESWGTKSVKTIARTLNRTTTAIYVKRDRLKLGRFDEAGDYITYSQVLKAIYGIDKAQHAYRVPIKGFPIKYKTIERKRVKIVEIDSLWKFLEERKRHFDFSKMEENIFGIEPDWVREKRKIDIECRKKKTKWTKSEDEQLHQYLKQYKYTYPELAVKLNRTEAAVKRRICTLKLKERAIRIEDKNWSEEEYKILKEMYQKGWSFDRIGERLGRSGLACQGKLEWLERKEKENGRKKSKMKSNTERVDIADKLTENRQHGKRRKKRMNMRQQNATVMRRRIISGNLKRTIESVKRGKKRLRTLIQKSKNYLEVMSRNTG